MLAPVALLADWFVPTVVLQYIKQKYNILRFQYFNIPRLLVAGGFYGILKF